MMTLWLVGGFALYLALASSLSQTASAMILYSILFSTILLFFVPERLYGTTIELLEGKVLRIVDALEQILVADELGLSEAAYFRVKENLEEARRTAAADRSGASPLAVGVGRAERPRRAPQWTNHTPRLAPYGKRPASCKAFFAPRHDLLLGFRRG